jgi:mono/diheme cytochrome c family protein
MHCRTLLVPMLILGVGVLAYAQQKPKIKYAPPERISPVSGPEMFRAYCAVCHGVDGKGTGPAAPALKKEPADLTQLSKKNGGKFPAVRVAGVIEGADVLLSHGSRDMPVWGSVFRSMGDDKLDLRLRVTNLANHVESLQQK